MEVKVLRLDRSFPAGPIGESLGPHTSLDSFLELVDETTRLEMQKFRFLDDARRCLLGRLLVRSVLSERCKVAHRTLEFYKTASGRPYAVQHSLPYFPIDFNVTHDTNLIAVATLLRDDSLEGRRVGIDLMSVRNPWEGTTVDEFLQGIAAQLTAKEQAKLESLGTDKARLQHALALWTLKEAYVKATGEGLHRDLSQLEFDLDLSEIKNGVAGSSSLEGDSLDKWSFDLVWLQEAEEEYLVAVAGNEAVGGKGEVRFWRTQPDWLKFVEFGEIVDRLCNGDTS
ncbi:hypothetical protein JCM5350_003665 [Sporobolomyces pararoseus]